MPIAEQSRRVLRLFVNDDTDEILVQIDRNDYLTVGKKVEEVKESDLTK